MKTGRKPIKTNHMWTTNRVCNFKSARSALQPYPTRNGHQPSHYNITMKLQMRAPRLKSTNTTKSTMTSQALRMAKKTDEHPSSSCERFSCSATLLGFALRAFSTIALLDPGLAASKHASKLRSYISKRIS